MYGSAPRKTSYLCYARIFKRETKIIYLIYGNKHVLMAKRKTAPHEMQGGRSEKKGNSKRNLRGLCRSTKAFVRADDVLQRKKFKRSVLLRC